MSTHFLDRIKKTQAMMATDSIAILPSAPVSSRNSSVEYTFRQSSDLLYLLGVNQPEVTLVIVKNNNVTESVFVFAPEADPVRSRWEGKSLNAAEICESAGLPAECGHSSSVFHELLDELLKRKLVLYTPLGQSNGFDQQLIQRCNQINKNARNGDYAPRRFNQFSELSFQLRVVKDEHELAQMQKAASISAQAHNEMMRFTRSLTQPVKEYQVKAFLESSFTNHGATELAYPSIVAAGKNGTILHYTQYHDSAKQGELLLVDAGCEWQGYASDITRTFPVSGEFTAAQKTIYEIVLAAQKSAIEASKPGETIDAVHKVAVKKLVEGIHQEKIIHRYPDPEEPDTWHENPSVDQVLEQELYRAYYMHRTSHFIGLDVHDVGSYFTGENSRQLEQNMVLTIEPGLYLDPDAEYVDEAYRSIAVRIEDDIVVQETKPLVLSREAVKTVDDIEALAPLQ